MCLKLEKINENQIRCTLYKEDLYERDMSLKELAYGSDKAKALFSEMMLMAATDFGFDSEGIPIMIESIPLSPESLVLIITKVEDPEELDVRFSSFAPSSVAEQRQDMPLGFSADDIINCFEKINEIISRRDKAIASGELQDTEDITEDMSIARVFMFGRMQEIIEMSHVVEPFYKGDNKLYKDERYDKFYLLLNISDHSAEDFNKVCNIAAEYGIAEPCAESRLAYFEEHYKVIIADKALQVLSMY
jgi:adapter protein MecA 1/2